MGLCLRSLIWNPAIKTAEERLPLGLDRGGECLGVAYRIAEEDIASELAVLWGREMLLGGYIPQRVELVEAEGRSFGRAITFVIDAQHHHYTGGISQRAIIQRLATAGGSWGSAADYLSRPIEALRDYGIHDAAIGKVGALVEAAMLLAIWPQEA